MTTTPTTPDAMTTPATITFTDDQLVLIPVTSVDEEGVPLTGLPNPLPEIAAYDTNGNDMSDYIFAGWTTDPEQGLFVGRAPFQTGQASSVTVTLSIAPGTASGKIYQLLLMPSAAAAGITEGTAQVVERTTLPAGVTLASPPPYTPTAQVTPSTPGAAPSTTDQSTPGS